MYKLFLILITVMFLFILINTYKLNTYKLNTYKLNENFNNKYNLYCFWTGNNKMSKDRKRCFDSLKNSGLNVILITPKNLNKYLSVPLHPAYKYLSETHKADYLRCYFMHFHGGAYSDIKYTTKSWVDSFKLLEKNKNAYANGYRENKNGVAKIHDNKINKLCQDNFYKLIGNGGYIFKANTPLTRKWYKKMIEKMDNIHERLKKYPSKSPQQVYRKEYQYPLEWAELLGSIFHPIIYEYHKNLLYTVPKYTKSAYR